MAVAKNLAWYKKHSSKQALTYILGKKFFTVATFDFVCETFLFRQSEKKNW